MKVKSVGGTRVLYVMATMVEFGEGLRARIEPNIIGIGPVEAALGMAALLRDPSKIDLVVSLGSAGSQVLEQCGVYQASSIAYRDMDASAIGFKKGVTPELDLPATVPLPLQISGLPKASLSTGASVVSGDAYATIPADMVDMETWSIFRACQKAEVPMIGLRGISDGVHPVAEYQDWTRYLPVVSEKLGQAIDLVEGNLGDGFVE